MLELKNANCGNFDLQFHEENIYMCIVFLSVETGQFYQSI